MTAAIASVINPHAKDLGGFEVRRLLPAFPKKTVGPFIFFDHMGPADFAAVAALMAAVVNDGARVSDQVEALRGRFTELRYCFSGPEFEPLMKRLHELL